jgi:hypothetical protein
MAVVQGVREKVHLPIYDSFHVNPKEQLRDVANGSSSTLKFFVDVQRKTKLETNLQSASLLPHYNTFEARAMRVVISDLPPEFAEEPKVEDSGLDVTDEEGNRIDFNGNIEGPGGGVFVAADAVTADIDLSLNRVMELLVEARETGEAALSADPEVEEGVSLTRIDGTPLTPDEITNVVDAGGVILLSASQLERLISLITPETKQPPQEQIRPNNGAGTVISKFIYNTVTTLYVGEKIMIQMPTWFFPAGAGPYSEAAKFTTHGEPSPTATFRFAEPIFIDKQQNFRVEIEVPDTEVLKGIQQIYGPLFIWVVLDGYMVRDVQ